MRNNSDDKKSYAEKLKDPQWQKKRLEILNRDRFKCRLCGDDQTSLQVHHKSYLSGKEPWECPNSNLITLCEHCHSEVEKINRYIKDYYNAFPKDFVLPYDNILIMKRIRSDGRRMIVSFPGHLFLVNYDSDNHCIDGWRIGDETSSKSFLKLVKNSFSGKL